MIGLEIFGVILVLIGIVIAFLKKNNYVGLALIIVLLVLLLMLGYFNP